MNKLRAIFAVLTVVTLFGTAALFCSAGGGGLSVEKGIVGTWINNEDKDETWTFGNDGTLTVGDRLRKYGVTDRMVAKTDKDGGSYDAWEASISSNGKTLILIGPRSSWWLTKQN
jgi:hypothetical protein